MPLNERDARKAAGYNRRAARRFGWKGDYPRIASLFGLDRQSDSKSQFAQAVYDWQAAQTPPLTKDGKLGPTTWAKLKRELDQNVTAAPSIPIPDWLGGGGGVGTQVIAPAPVAGAGRRWVQIARMQARRWATEIDSWGSELNGEDPETLLDWDEAYFVAAPRWGEITHGLGEPSDRADRDWCAAFVNYCLHRAGYSHTGSAGANSFARSWAWRFDALREPQQGCVIVVGNADTGHGGHVAFLDTWDNLPSNPGGHVQNRAGRVFHLLGGNQAARVNSRREPVRANRDLLAARGQNGVTSPYLMPRQGPHTCNIGSVIPTEQPHHCHYVPPED